MYKVKYNSEIGCWQLIRNEGSYVITYSANKKLLDDTCNELNKFFGVKK